VYWSRRAVRRGTAAAAGVPVESERRSCRLSVWKAAVRPAKSALLYSGRAVKRRPRRPWRRHRGCATIGEVRPRFFPRPFPRATRLLTRREATMFTRRRAAEFGVLGILAGLLLVGPRAASGEDEVRPGAAKPGPTADGPPPATGKPERPGGAPSDRALRHALEAAAAAIRAEDWPRAAKLLDGVLGTERDLLLTV